MSSAPIVTRGATSVPPGFPPDLRPVPPARREAHDLVKDERQFSLFIQALQRFHDRKEDLDDSYFQVSGIHGLPYVRWNGAGPEQPVGRPAGYCQHSTVIFPTWHRPYCALFEQLLQGHAVDIAAEYTFDREAWGQAAIDLRFPFWDWALHPLPPKQFYDPREYSRVSIILRNGQTTSVENPLLAYRFQSGHAPEPPAPPEGASPEAVQNYRFLLALSKLPRTIFHPTLPLEPTSTPQIDRFERVLRREFEDTRPNTADLLLYVKDWYGFSTQRAASGGFTRSLEAIHNTLHVRIGQQGHMNFIPFAAFDPLFWLHHFNVDRMLALWQYINYATWVSPRDDAGVTWVTRPGSRVDENTQLAPFWINSNNFWTSAECRAPSVLRYTYPDFKDLNMNDLPAVCRAITARVRRLYYDEKTFPAFPGAVPTSGPARGAVAEAQAALTTNTAEARRPNASIEWAVRIRAKQSDVRQINSILIFLGGVPDDHYNYSDDERYAGSFDPFANPFPGLCQNCVDGQDIVVEGFVHITYSLVRRGLDVLDISAVEDHLRSNLKWVPQLLDGDFVGVECVPSLEVTVIDTPVELGEDSELPVIGGVRKHNGVTLDLPGGRTRAPNRA